MQENVIPFDLMTYPGEKHAFAGEPQRMHVYEMISRFLGQHLHNGD